MPMIFSEPFRRPNLQSESASFFAHCLHVRESYLGVSPFKQQYGCDGRWVVILKLNNLQCRHGARLRVG